MTAADVTIIGAGPAAMAAAITCAGHGLGVLALAGRGSRRVGYESVPPGLEVLAARLGAPYAVQVASRGAFDGIWRDGVFSELGATDGIPWLGHHIDRDMFDDALSGAAAGAGVALVDEEAIDVERTADIVTAVCTSSTRIATRYVIDASGRRQWLARRLGLAIQRTSAPLLAWTAQIASSAADQRPIFATKPDGWSWTAPHGDGSATWTRVVFAGGGRPRFDDGEPLTKAVGHDVGWRIVRPVVLDNLALVGDAASVVDPGSGQGVFRALRSGMRAADAIVGVARAPDISALLLAEYDSWVLAEHTEQVRQLEDLYRSNAVFRACSTKNAWLAS